MAVAVDAGEGGGGVTQAASDYDSRLVVLIQMSGEIPHTLNER